MVNLLKIIVLLIVAISLFVYFLLSMDVQTNYYTNKQEVLKKKAILRGWMPSILPDTAYEIKETINIDTNEFSGSFKYLEVDENIFLGNLTKKENIFIWKNFQFKVNTTKNEVNFSSSTELDGLKK